MGAEVRLIINSKDSNENLIDIKDQILNDYLGDEFFEEFYGEVAEDYGWYIFDESQYKTISENEIMLILCQYDDHDYEENDKNFNKVLKSTIKKGNAWAKKLEESLGSDYTITVEESHY